MVTHSTHPPQHIAIIMDGNGRWAKQRLLPRQAGHRAGAKAVRTLLESCLKDRISYLTLFAFSSENWKRSSKEVNHLFTLFLEHLESELPRLQKNNIRLRVIGERENLEVALRDKITHVEEETVDNTALELILAVSYGGQWDICEAARQLAKQVKEGQLAVEEITPERFEAHLATREIPPIDLLIRTSGEKRISNFLLWQAAYAEFYFTDTLWPDFDEKAFDDALVEYAKRQRKFGA